MSGKRSARPQGTRTPRKANRPYGRPARGSVGWPMVGLIALHPSVAYRVLLEGHAGLLRGNRVHWDESRGWLGAVVFDDEPNTWVECNLVNLTMEGLDR